MPAWSLTGECYPIDFTGIDIEYYAGRGVYQLTVTGVKPYHQYGGLAQPRGL